jgi:1,4-alpha-glucan branching enzyme
MDRRAATFGIIGSISVVERKLEKKLIKVAKPGRNGTVRVTFALPADEPPGAVSVVGDFNNWNPHAHPLRRRANGTRSAVVTVDAGSMLHFRYLAEGGVWFDDESAPAADGRGANITV